MPNVVWENTFGMTGLPNSAVQSKHENKTDVPYYALSVSIFFLCIQFMLGVIILWSRSYTVDS